MSGHGTVTVNEYFQQDAIRGSLRLRNALFRFAGYKVPSRAGRPRKPVALPHFALVAPQAIRRGRPKGYRKEYRKLPEIQRIQILVARRCRVRIENLRSHRRNPKDTRARHIAMYLARRITEESYPTIAFNFGRDHSTVVYAFDKVQALVDAGDQFAIRVINDVYASLA